VDRLVEAIQDIFEEYGVQIILGIVANLVAAFFIFTFTNWKAALCFVAVALMFFALFIIAKMVGRADDM